MVVTGCQCGGVDVRVRHQCGDVWSGVRASVQVLCYRHGMVVQWVGVRV